MAVSSSAPPRRRRKAARASSSVTSARQCAQAPAPARIVRQSAKLQSRAAPPPRAAASARLPGLDALRGLAIVGMVAYHFCFDLRWFGFARFDLEHAPGWIAARSAILGSFLLIAGASLSLAARRPDFQRRYVRQVATVGGAAPHVSIASYLAFPATFIWFGVLHAIAVALVLARPLLGRPALAAALGLAVVAAGLLGHAPAFDTPALGWIGFMTHKPATEDYVPLFPWAGLLLIGTALGTALARQPERLAPLARGTRALQALGRHSLAVYLVHQPVLVALLWLAARR